jgi:MoxR-like ATPase
MATVTFLNGIEADRTFTLNDGKPTVIGRNAGCDIIIKEAVISSQHARIEQQDGVWLVTDLKSSNGTAIDGKEVRTATPLHHDSILLLGDEIRVRFSSDGAAVQPARPAAAAGTSANDVTLVEQMKQNTDLIRREVAKVIIGQTEVLDQVLMVLLAGGHGLLVGMPGMAKTLMVSTIAKVLDMDFKRIQFTPDLMPTDMTGTEILQTNRVTNDKEFQFVRGPIFCNLLLADEINRTPPKTQAALLEAMQEKRVTVGNTTYPLDKPFFVLATQNPIEQEGTYPLPEAQLDRFMFNIWVDYPLEHEEEEIVKTTTVTQMAEPRKVLTKQDVLQLQDVVRKIPVSTHVIKYAIRLVRSTRPNDPKAPDFIKQYVSTGAGPRAGQFLVLAAKARAVTEGRIHVSCKDIRRAAVPVLRHRILTNFAADSEGLSSMALVERLLTTIEEPNEKDYA